MPNARTIKARAKAMAKALGLAAHTLGLATHLLPSTKAVAKAMKVWQVVQVVVAEDRKEVKKVDEGKGE